MWRVGCWLSRLCYVGVRSSEDLNEDGNGYLMIREMLCIVIAGWIAEATSGERLGDATELRFVAHGKRRTMQSIACGEDRTTAAALRRTFLGAIKLSSNLQSILH